MTRSSGSVPEGRTSTRPRPSSFEFSSLDRVPERLRSLDRAAVGDLHVLEPLRQALEGLDVRQAALAQGREGEQGRGDRRRRWG